MLSIAAKESCIERVKDGHAMNGKKGFGFEKNEMQEDWGLEKLLVSCTVNYVL